MATDGISATYILTMPALSLNVYTLRMSVLNSTLGLAEEESILSSILRTVQIEKTAAVTENNACDSPAKESLQTKTGKANFSSRSTLQCKEEILVKPEYSGNLSRTNVTLATVASLDRALSSLYTAAHWDGPVSIVYFAHSDQECHALRKFVSQILALFCHTRGQNLIVTLLSLCSGFISDNMAHFPINTLRRAAVAAAETDLVLYVDADFIPSHQALQYIATYYLTSNSLDVLILPCFMNLPNNTWPKAPQISRDSNDNPMLLLENLRKSRLAVEVTARRAMMPAPFHSHGATNYQFWLQQLETSAPYTIDYTLWYEPYFVINTSRWSGIKGRGLFDERFYFGGGDKVQLAYEVAALGYTFKVHPAMYLVHVPQKLWQSQPCDSGQLTSSFCDLLELARRRTMIPRPVMHFSSYLHRKFSSFIVNLPLWNWRTQLPGVLCFQPPIRI